MHIAGLDDDVDIDEDIVLMLPALVVPQFEEEELLLLWLLVLLDFLLGRRGTEGGSWSQRDFLLVPETGGSISSSSFLTFETPFYPEYADDGDLD